MKAQVKQSDANVKLAQANQATARANLANAQLNYSFTIVRAPLTGRLSRRVVDPGNVVVGDATVLTTVVSLDPIYVYFDIDERTMLRLERLSQETRMPVPWKPTRTRKPKDGIVAAIGKSEPLERPGIPAAGLIAGGYLPFKLGMPVAIGLADEEGFTHQGVMNFADNVVNRSTGTLRVRGEFANPDLLLSPGMFCRVQVPVGSAHEAVLVDDKALGSDQERKYLFVLNDQNETIRRDVKVERCTAGCA